MSEMPSIDRVIELERADAARMALEEAAQRLEAQAGGETYRKAFKASAAILRGLVHQLDTWSSSRAARVMPHDGQR
jgi:hypothetical protein